ncbi:hypothetical protein SDC9_211589 [bioreactor metagenome]|uniref:Uncharacterized protein n=1 Tax=bioreactor metagenome TaxID=1076179 RepID=A0A645JXE2_9ZZZZ
MLPLPVPAVDLAHLLLILGQGLGAQSLDGGRHHIAKAVFIADVALALDAEAGDPVAGDLGQQRPADPLQQEGKARMLQHALMAHFHEFAQKGLLILLGYQAKQRIHIAARIAKARAKGDQLFGMYGGAYQLHPLDTLGH